jgi:hypothetical protein
MKQTVVFDMHKIIYRHSEEDYTQIEPMPHAIETFLYFYNSGYKIVIISTSQIQDSRERLQFLLESHGLPSDDVAEVLKKIDILSMQFFGDKNNAEDWQKAMEPYKNIEYIFEDGENKLKAAGEAATNLGYKPQLYGSTTEFVSSL